MLLNVATMLLNQRLFNRTIAIVLLILAFAYTMDAQCPMCRMSAETNLRNGGTEGQGLNIGILYMLAIPYILVGVVGYLWWKNRSKFSR